MESLMLPAMNHAAAAYARIGIETGVPDADPHRLILMLFDGAIVSIAQAKRAIAERDFAGKGEALSRAIDIVDQGLRASLDAGKGGALAAQLDRLYQYISLRLLTASSRNDTAILAEASALLEDLRSAWAAIEQQSKNGAANGTLHPPTERH
jgi:flagellar protein FliS